MFSPVSAAYFFFLLIMLLKGHKYLINMIVKIKPIYAEIFGF